MKRKESWKMNEKRKKWLSKTRLNNRDSLPFYSQQQRTPQYVNREPEPWRDWPNPAPDCMEALGSSHPATMMYICDILEMQVGEVSKKISGCRCSFLLETEAFHVIMLGGYALPRNRARCSSHRW